MIDQLKNNLQLHRRLVDEFETTQLQTVIDIADCICQSIENGGCVYICGNGGSAADAQHISGELVGRYLRHRKGYPAVALTTDTSILTSVANDYTFEKLFSRQVEALVRPNDILLCLSTSGASSNILEAARQARSQNATIIGFTGKANTPLQQNSDLCLWIDAPSAGPAQEIHQIAYHMICDLVEERLARTVG